MAAFVHFLLAVAGSLALLSGQAPRDGYQGNSHALNTTRSRLGQGMIIPASGDVGCAVHGSGSYCWRYCSGDSGKWCYTSQETLPSRWFCNEKAMAVCRSTNMCAGLSCDGAEAGCVRHCQRD